LSGGVNVAVHSLKDVPAQLLSNELDLMAYSPREDPRDAWFHRGGLGMDELDAGAVVATGSLRRRCQLLRRRPDLEIVPLRGNVNTRWRKFEEGQFEAMVLAAAGVLRLGWKDRITALVEPEILLPAVGQGIVGLECRVGSRAAELVAAIDDPDAAMCARAERALLEGVAGGCVVPLAGHCRRGDDGQLELRARLGRPDGTDVLEAQATGSADDPVALGQDVAEQLLRQGGEAIVRETKEMASRPPE
jgi:hydroxymethylbilane synthase